MVNLFSKMIELNQELEVNSANLDPFQPNTVDQVRSTLTKMETTINAARHELGKYADMLSAMNSMIDLLDTTLGA